MPYEKLQLFIYFIRLRGSWDQSFVVVIAEVNINIVSFFSFTVSCLYSASPTN